MVVRKKPMAHFTWSNKKSGFLKLNQDHLKDHVFFLIFLSYIIILSWFLFQIILADLKDKEKLRQQVLSMTTSNAIDSKIIQYRSCLLYKELIWLKTYRKKNRYLRLSDDEDTPNWSVFFTHAVLVRIHYSIHCL